MRAELMRATSNESGTSNSSMRRGGTGDRHGAQEESRAAARSLSTLGAAIVLIDTSLRPSAFASSVAESMDARYVALPFADAGAISGVARAARRPEPGLR